MKTLLILVLTVAAFGQQKVVGPINLDGAINGGTSAVGTDSYAITTSSEASLRVKAYAANQCFTFTADVTNTGAASLAVDGLTAKTIKKAEGGVTTDLADNEIRANQVVTVCYDGTNLQMQSRSGVAPSGGSSLTSNAGDSPFFPTVSFGVVIANRAMGTGQVNCDPFTTQVSMQFRYMRFFLSTVSAAGTGARGLIMTRASDGALSMIAETSGILTDSGAGSFKDMAFSGGSAVSGGVLTLPAAQNYRICLVNDGAPSITQTSSASDPGVHYLFNGWNGSAYTLKNIVYSTTGVSGTGTAVNVSSPLTAANQTVASGRGVMVLALVP